MLKKVGEPAAIAATTTIKDIIKSVEVLPINFGKVENQISHTFRHIESIGLDKNIVKDAISSDLKKIASSASMSPYNGFVIVNGIRLDYVAYRLPDGTINVGRITPPR